MRCGDDWAYSLYALDPEGTLCDDELVWLRRDECDRDLGDDREMDRGECF